MRLGTKLIRGVTNSLQCNSCDPGGGVGWLSSCLAIYQTLSNTIYFIIASALPRVARVSLVYLIVYLIVCAIDIAMHPFDFYGFPANK